MKALTIRQPYAWLIVAGHKPIENRSWSTNHRGPLLIHAGRKWHDDWPDRIKRFDIDIPIAELKFGGIIGVVEVTGIVRASDSIWFEGPIGWTLDNPRALPFVEASGSQTLFDVDVTI